MSSAVTPSANRLHAFKYPGIKLIGVLSVTSAVAFAAVLEAAASLTAGTVILSERGAI
jgi:hypothetical protein